MDMFFYFYTRFKEITDFFLLNILIFLAVMTKKGFHIIFIFSCKISWLGNCKSLRKTRRKSLHYQICISYFNYIKFNCNIAILKYTLKCRNLEILTFWGGFFALFWKCPTKTFYTGIFFLKPIYFFNIFEIYYDF